MVSPSLVNAEPNYVRIEAERWVYVEPHPTQSGFLFRREVRFNDGSIRVMQSRRDDGLFHWPIDQDTEWHSWPQHRNDVCAHPVTQPSWWDRWCRRHNEQRAQRARERDRLARLVARYEQGDPHWWWDNDKGGGLR